MSRRLGYRQYRALPPGWIDAEWSYRQPRGGYRRRNYNWQGRYRHGLITGSFYALNQVENWRIRGEMARDYYKNTGYKPRYYNQFTRRKQKW